MSDPSPLDAHLGFWLRQVSNHVSQAFALKLKAHGVSVAEWVVLSLLWVPSSSAMGAEGTRPPSGGSRRRREAGAGLDTASSAG